MEGLKDAVFEKVVPRILRPLESHGRKVEPVLLHGDLWVGNTATDKESGTMVMFDSSAFYGHNECELKPPLYFVLFPDIAVRI